MAEKFYLSLKGNKDKKSLFPINTTGHSQTGASFRVSDASWIQ